jgi:phosphoglycolate phosphatase
MLPFEAVLFDLDGTLLNTLEDLADSMNHALVQVGLPQHPVEAYRLFVGDGVESLAVRAAPQAAADPDLLQNILIEMRSEYSKRWDAKSRPYPGIGELLDALTARGIKKAVFSNKPHDFTELCVSKLLGQWQFDAVRGVSPRTPRKPDPRAALDIAQNLRIDPSAFAYLGDTDTDMRTATGANMYAIGVLWGFRHADELLSNGARALISHPLELFSLQF